MKPVRGDSEYEKDNDVTGCDQLGVMWNDNSSRRKR